MTTPADNTPASIIQDAYTDAGKLQRGQTPNSEQLVSGMRRLTDMIKFWQTQGLKLWLMQDLSITLVAGTATYTLGLSGNVVMAKPLQGIQAYWLDTNGNKTPLIVISQSDYLLLPQVTQRGALNSVYVDKQQNTLNITTYLTPDATAAAGTLHVLIRNSVTSFISVTETMNFPDEWRIALRWGLAAELATGQPKDVQDRCDMRAQMYRTALEDWDVEDAPTRFTVDQRLTGFGFSRFR